MTDCDLYLNVFIPAITDHAINSDMQRCCDPAIPLTKCDANRNIIELNITGDKGLVVGVIPPEIGLFKKLQSLKINDNALKGTIPNELYKIATLTTIDLKGNNFSGFVPASIAEFPGVVKNIPKPVVSGTPEKEAADKAIKDKKAKDKAAAEKEAAIKQAADDKAAADAKTAQDAKDEAAADAKTAQDAKDEAAADAKTAQDARDEAAADQNVSNNELKAKEEIPPEPQAAPPRKKDGDILSGTAWNRADAIPLLGILISLLC
jgi:hypothetical protein